MMMFRALRRAVLTLLPWGAGLAVALAAPGCSTADLQAYCEQRESCRGGNDKDIDACVAAEELEEYVANDIGCSDEHVVYNDCLLEKGKCAVVSSGQPCQTSDDCGGGGQCTTNNECESKDFELEGDDCDVERRAYSRCSNLN